MFRYRIVAYYEDRVSRNRVARTLIIIAPDDEAARELVEADLSNIAGGGHIAAIETVEKAPITSCVAHRSDPYIPLHWPEETPPPSSADSESPV